MNISKKPKPKENPPTILDDINNQINYKLFSCYNAFKYIFKNFYNNLGFYFGFIGIFSPILGIIVFLCVSKGSLTKEIFSGCKSIPNSNKKKDQLQSNPPRKRNIEEKNKGKIKTKDIQMNNKEEKQNIILNDNKSKKQNDIKYIKIKKSQNNNNEINNNEEIKKMMLLISRFN